VDEPDTRPVVELPEGVLQLGDAGVVGYADEAVAGEAGRGGAERVVVAWAGHGVVPPVVR
jgi:hypothetical protein